ncbi:hypothetical protein ABPG74_009382 [Tetrahymena malaccensis]
MGGCISNHCQATSYSSTSESQPQCETTKKQFKYKIKSQKQMISQKKEQNNLINQWLGQFKGISFQIEILKEQLLSKMEHQKKYKSLTIDKLFSECYYRNLIQPNELIDFSKNIKDISSKLEALIKRCSQKELYQNANPELIDELNFCMEGFTPFVRIADQILIPQNQTNQVKTIQDLVPVLTRSQSLN